jgi:hypothetical protein
VTDTEALILFYEQLLLHYPTKTAEHHRERTRIVEVLERLRSGSETKP